MSDAAKFHWVEVAPGRCRTKSRRTIRQHVMREPAARRKQTGAWGKQNVGQWRVVRFQQEGQKTGGQDEDASSSFHSQAWASSPGRPMSVTGLERVAVDTGINILDLNELTHIHMGHAAGVILSRQPGTLSRLASHRRDSFLAHLVPRFGHSPSLDDALRCVALKARRFMCPGCAPPSAAELSLHGRALRSLQAAVGDSTGWSNPDVLCTIQILSMYELLNFSSSFKAWEQHIAGAVLVAKARGPHSFSMDFEKGLLLSLMAPIICECLRLGQPCLFEEQDWQRTLLSAANDSDVYTTQSRIYVRLSLLCASLPRIFTEVTKAVVHPDCTCSDAALDDLESELDKLENATLQWRNDLATLGSTYSLDTLSSVEQDHRTQLDSASLGMLAMICRLKSAISQDRISPELRSLSYVHQMKQILSTAQPVNPWAEFYLAQKVMMPHSILDSSEQWSLPSATKGRVIEDWKFNAWKDAVSKAFERLHL